MFKKILVPVDMSHPELAHPAVNAAMEIAKLSGGAIRLLTVLPVMPNAVAGYLPPDFEENQKKTVLAELHKQMKRIDELGERVSCAVRTGSIQHETLEEAVSFGADLIAMGSHQPDLKTYILGTHAGNIIRHAHCSVLVIRH